MRNTNKEYLIWLNKAKDDLLWTEANIREKIYYGACFTSQQSIEKALKAYLVYKKGKFSKKHDLVTLVDECSFFDRNFTKYRRIVAPIAFYYIQTRYPDISEVDIYDKKEAEEAFEIAKELLDFVDTKIKKI